MKRRLIAAFVLIIYIAILIKVMVFKEMPVIRIGTLMFNFGGTQEGPANLLPLKTILRYLLGDKGLIIGGINLIGNIALLVPIGFLVPFVFRNITWKKTLGLAIATGFVIEGMQGLLHVGIFDIDDVILNALGVMIGYWAFAILAKWVRSGNYKTIIIAATIVIAAVIAALYAIHPKGHQPVNSVTGAAKGQSDRVNIREGEIPQTGDPQGDDPCNGTGGTGQIGSAGDNTITIKLGDGVS